MVRRESPRNKRMNTTKLAQDKDRELTKKQIRSKILLRLRTQKEEDRSKKSRLIKAKLFKSGVFKRAKKLMFYVAFNGEVDTKKMIKGAQKLGKTVAVPACAGSRMIKPCLLKKNARMRKGRYGIYEPAIKQFVNLNDLDLVVVPGVAFDKKGNRLGRGKGYYDTFLKKLPKRTASLGLAFDFQVLPFVPVNTRDVSINKVIFA